MDYLFVGIILVGTFFIYKYIKKHGTETRANGKSNIFRFSNKNEKDKKE